MSGAVLAAACRGALRGVPAGITVGQSDYKTRRRAAETGRNGQRARTFEGRASAAAESLPTGRVSGVGVSFHVVSSVPGARLPDHHRPRGTAFGRDSCGEEASRGQRARLQSLAVPAGAAGRSMAQQEPSLGRENAPGANFGVWRGFAGKVRHGWAGFREGEGGVPPLPGLPWDLGRGCAPGGGGGEAGPGPRSAMWGRRWRRSSAG